MSSTLPFQLHERLAADSIAIGAFRVSQLRLMNNRLWPWLLLIPQFDDVSELHHLPAEATGILITEITALSQALPALFPVDKVNVGMLGNIVSQLHIHVLGRRVDDPAWPGPVWGSGHSQPYSAEEAGTIVGRLRDHLGIVG